MKIYNIKDLNNIPSIGNAKTFTIRDRHNGGRDTIDITGFWIINDEQLAIDIGERIHCLNEVVFNKDTDCIELGISSIAGVYNAPTSVYNGNGNNDVTARITFDSIEEVNKYFLANKRLRLETIRASKAK